jgi:glucose/arabinose dehydrogenase
MRALSIASTGFALAGGLLALQLATNNPPKLPAPYHTPSANNRPNVVEKPSGAKLNVPTGFVVEEYLSGFERPRYMVLGPSNEVILTDAIANGSVYVLNGKEKKKLLSGLDRPYGLAWWKDYLYVAETTSVKRYKYNKSAMTVGAGEEIVPLKDFGKGHWTRTIAFDAKGEKLYLGVGSQSNVDAGEDPMRAAISVMNPDGSGRELFATGTRNPTAIHFHPASGQLWAAVQERDGLGDDLVPDYFTSIKKGGFYGWPFSYIGPNADPRRNENPAIVKTTIVPDHILGAHVAVIDFAFINNPKFPAEYREGAYLALHGSWNRSKRVGYSVAFVPMKGGKITGPQKDFLTGWMLSPDQSEVWGRPVAILQMPDGSLLVSEDGGNKIWRVSYKG